MVDRVNWTQVAVFGVVALLVLLLIFSFLPFGWGGGMMGPGMMGGWGGATGGSWGVLGWILPLIGLLFPLGLLALLIVGGVWFFRQIGGPRSLPPDPGRDIPGKTCPSCSRAVQADWQLCPYCGQELV